MVLKVRLCSLYAARATNLLIRAEPMQRRILDWGREVVAVFQEGSKNSTLGGWAPVQMTYYQHHSLLINRTCIQQYNTENTIFLPFIMSLYGKLNTFIVIPYSYTPYSDQINKLSKPIVPIRQMGSHICQLTAKFNPKPASL